MAALLLALLLHGPVTITPGPVVCHPAVCTQHRTIRDTQHAVIQVRHRPAESRTAGRVPWGSWHVQRVGGAW